MRRLTHSVPPAAPVPYISENIITETRDYTLITPLFGGGVKTFEYDPVTVVRASEVRGQLRFWWRACRGASIPNDPRTMKEREDAIWGRAAQKKDTKIGDAPTNVGRLEMSVQVTSKGRPVTPFPIIEITEKRTGAQKYAYKFNADSDVPAYGAFPLQPNQKELDQITPPQPAPPDKEVYHNVRFTLTIHFLRQYEDDIHAALWAWETFGGIGARTRRGFGSLHLKKVKISVDANKSASDIMDVDGPQSASNEDIRIWLRHTFEQHVLPGSWLDGTPHLSVHPRLRFTNPYGNVISAWKACVRKLSSFRQISFGRVKRSYWPEAETVRTYTDRRDKDKYAYLGHPKKFPRAVFGLPLVFHFKDARDPFETTLQVQDKKVGANVTEKRDRLASPLILKPLMCQNGQSVGLALILDGTHLPSEGLVLKENKKTGREIKAVPVKDTQLDQTDLSKLPDLELNGETDILRAFMTYFGGYSL